MYEKNFLGVFNQIYYSQQHYSILSFPHHVGKRGVIPANPFNLLVHSNLTLWKT